MSLARFAKPRDATDEQWDALVKLDNQVEVAMTAVNESFHQTRVPSSQNSSKGNDLNVQKRGKINSKVFVRVRPMLQNELDEGATCLPGLVLETTTPSDEHSTTKKVEAFQTNGDNTSSIGGFDAIFGQQLKTEELFERFIKNESLLQNIVRNGDTLNLFCYRHSGTGKTYTVIGTEHEMGVFELITSELIDEINTFNEEFIDNEEEKLILQIKVTELYMDNVYDILDDNKECTLRDDYNGTLCIRGKVDVRNDGKVYVPTQKSMLVSQLSDITNVLSVIMERRSTGSSSIHDQSSRLHAVVEIKIINDILLKAYQDVEEAEATLHPIGKRKDDLLNDLNIKLINIWQDETGKNHIMPLCDVSKEAGLRSKHEDQHLSDSESNQITTTEWFKTHARMANEVLQAIQDFEVSLSHLQNCLERKDTILNNARFPCFQSSITLVDLAGNDYDHRSVHRLKNEKVDSYHKKGTSTLKERQESNRINKDLLAVKECISSIAQQSRMNYKNKAAARKVLPPFRNSKLTRILQRVLLPKESMTTATTTNTMMIATASPDAKMQNATINTLRYAQMLNGYGDLSSKSSSSLKIHSSRHSQDKPWQKQKPISQRSC